MKQLPAGALRVVTLLLFTLFLLTAAPFADAVFAAAGDDLLPPGAAPQSAAGRAGAVQILEVDNNTVGSLRNLSTQGRAQAVSLGASRAALQADPAAWLALAGWVRDGGVVFLHTDAAQLFGYETIAARPATAQVPGQLFGRAANAIPFGAHPLLWSGTAARPGLPALTASARPLPELGVQTVYYQMDLGDHLVVGHPAATPLLRVTDFAVASPQALYAAAIAPFGNGWAVFTPRLVEQDRAEGASFVQNLMRLAGGAGAGALDPPLGQPVAPRSPVEPLVGMAVSLVERASQVAQANQGYDVLGPEWTKATARATPAVFTEPAAIGLAETEPRLMLTLGEATAITTALGQAMQGAATTPFRTLAYLLRARLELQNNDLVSARTWLEEANALAPNAAEVLLWQGVWSAASYENILLDSRTRGAFLSAAVNDWRTASTAAPLVAATPAAGPTTPALAAARTLSGVPLSALQNWIAAATRAGELALVEPPLVTPIGSAGRLVVLRHFADDPTLRTAIPAGALLTQADRLLGWGVEAEEILIFPNDRYYAAYSQSARLGTQQVAFSPLANRGNVVNNRILMVSQITVPILIDPGPPPRYAQLGAAVPAIIGRLHAQVLMNAATQDGGAVPEWMQLGFMSLSNIAVTSTLANNQPVPESLSQSAAAGGLLTPDQFRGVNLGEDRTGLAEAQARRLVLFMYARFGTGAVVETLQRIGSGESADEALMETTGLTEAEFFLAWRNAEFGNRPRNF